MPKAEGLLLPYDDQSHIRTDILEVIPYAGERQTVHLDYPEFSCVCPFSGLPDVAHIYVQYVPRDKIVELKSLKYYYISFRNVGIYQEDMTQRVYQDLKRTLRPESLYVRTVYNVRGGIEAACEIGQKTEERP
jgi:7-cyano-7-deazaguanine reductase